jgi:hypothetical protein
MAEEAASIERKNPQMSAKEVLEAAYERAIWKHSEIRQQILESQQKQKEERERGEAAKRVADAKKASSSIVSSPNGKTVNADMSRAELLSALWDEHAN